MIAVNNFCSSKDINVNQCGVIWNKITVAAAMVLGIKKENV